MNWYKKAQTQWVYHNTKTEFLSGIKSEGLTAGSFATKPIAVFGDIWLAVDRNIFPPNAQQHQYGNVTAIEPNWDDFSISPDLIYIATKRGKILGKLNELV